MHSTDLQNQEVQHSRFVLDIFFKINLVLLFVCAIYCCCDLVNDVEAIFYLR